MAITEELKRIYASAPIASAYVETVELTHSQFPVAGNKYYLNNSYHDKMYLLDPADVTQVLFQAIPFVVSLPAIDSGGQQDLQIAISNVGKVLMDAIEASNAAPEESIKCIYRVYLDQANDAPQSDPIELAITDINVSMDAITAMATRADTLNRIFPSELYRTDLFPGLDR
jgi:hypothetical protein